MIWTQNIIWAKRPWTINYPMYCITVIHPRTNWAYCTRTKSLGFIIIIIWWDAIYLMHWFGLLACMPHCTLTSFMTSSFHILHRFPLQSIRPACPLHVRLDGDYLLKWCLLQKKAWLWLEIHGRTTLIILAVQECSRWWYESPSIPHSDDDSTFFNVFT